MNRKNCLASEAVRLRSTVRQASHRCAAWRRLRAGSNASRGPSKLGKAPIYRKPQGVRKGYSSSSQNPLEKSGTRNANSPNKAVDDVFGRTYGHDNSILSLDVWVTSSAGQDLFQVSRDLLMF
jgi:hypothetical protein